MLWWKVHEPGAPELAAARGDVQPRLDRGNWVGAAARASVPGGLLINEPLHDLQERAEATARAIASGAQVIYEASVLADGLFASVDILERKRGGFVLVEVKSSLDVKPEHIPDVAFQVHAFRLRGVVIKRAEVMHLNRAARYPDLSNLFVRRNVTPQVNTALRSVPRRARSLLASLAGPLPEVKTGAHCTEPHECPFMGRCWPAIPKHHVSTLYRISPKKLQSALKDGHETLLDLPGDFATSGPAQRQVQSVRKRRIVVEPGLGPALNELESPIAFLDFETVAPPIPAWGGCRPYEQVPVQFSCHVQGPRGVVHHEWLAEGRADPREHFAKALLSACDGARTVLAYNAPFEKGCITGLVEAIPRLAPQLSRLLGRIKDLLPIVRDHVYHPAFLGSFSIKSVLPALVSGMSYEDLEIQDGMTASMALESLLFDGEALAPVAKQAMRRALLRYCERDTLAMVRLHERLLDLSVARR